mgnify:CR=1 FL=1
MTQKQRMEQGLIYDPTADEIMNEQTGVAQYLKEYNSLGLGDEKRIEELLRLMLAECGENCYIQPPFYANWGGAHLHLGNNVYANLLFEIKRYKFYTCEMQWVAEPDTTPISMMVISKKPLTAHKGNTIEVAALNKPFYLSK